MGCWFSFIKKKNLNILKMQSFIQGVIGNVQRKKVVVRDDQGNDVNSYIYILRPYTKDRGTRHWRLEVPLKECFESMLRAYRDKNFPVKYLYKALTEAIKDYYEIDSLAN